jgi:RNA polymerase sigma-32 factor
MDEHDQLAEEIVDERFDEETRLDGRHSPVSLLDPEAEAENQELALVDTSHEPRELVRFDPLRRYLWEIKTYGPLSPEEEQHFARLYRKDQNVEAARRLVTANLKLVVKIAFLYNKVYSNLMDLIQEGNIGLLQAVKRFDPDRGTRLPTYASWWIKAYIIKFILDNFRIVKVGTTNDRRKVLMNLRKEKRRLESQGISATSARLAEALNVSHEDVVAVERSIESRDVSLDQAISDESSANYLETLASAEQLIDEKLAAGELKDLIETKFKEFASTLAEKDRVILRDRLVAEEPLTLQSIADQFGLTREAIRVAEKKLVEKIKTYMKTALKGISDIDFGLRD